ncbi:hypothetical protein [Jannaschia aquimarina]|uniref:Lipoprotein n=1 Tax=Jannaschia aquimarina TaxID=935700 RepID=A0A0D1EL43_9RHOB|nr:hypothetical protein [Jannaschia aquimarina]KIT16465.1 hypothetical protein jaqu_17890 [Jannaschia aquimarina]SNS87509.1 hypothetical protein SAMN05421775_103109 [Jannaschia aquimarina]
MIRRALILGGAAVALLSACVASPVAAPDDLAAFQVVDVRVEAARAVAEAEKPVEVLAAEVEAIVARNVQGVLDGVRSDGTRPVVADVLVMRLFVPTVASAALTARGAAAMDVSVQLRDAQTGEAIGGPRGLRAHADTRFGGVLAAVMTAQALEQGGQAGEIARAARSLGGRMAEIIYGITPS